MFRVWRLWRSSRILTCQTRACAGSATATIVVLARSSVAGYCPSHAGGVRVNAWVSGGFLPESVRGTKYDGLATGWDWCAYQFYACTLCLYAILVRCLAALDDPFVVWCFFLLVAAAYSVYGIVCGSAMPIGQMALFASWQEWTAPTCAQQQLNCHLSTPTLWFQCCWARVAQAAQKSHLEQNHG